MKCKKYNSKNIRRVSFSYFPKIVLDYGSVPLMPFRIFLHHVKIFNSSLSKVTSKMELFVVKYK